MPAECVVCAKGARVWCVNDGAFLCEECDVQIHSNAVARRHQRVPVCELCQDTKAVVFCRQDAAYLCKGCDTEMHALSPFSHDVKPLEGPPAEAPAEALSGVSGRQEEAHGSFEAASSADAHPDLLLDAIVPVAPAPAGSASLAPARSASVKDDFLKNPSWGKEFEFDVLDLDNSWLDMGFDFSDILGADADEVGRVPSMRSHLSARMDGAVPCMPADFSVDMKPVVSMPMMEQPRISLRRSSAPSSHSSDMFVPQMPFDSMFMEQPNSYAVPTMFHSAPPPVAPAPQRQVASSAAPMCCTFQQAAAATATTFGGANLTRAERVARYREKRKNRTFQKTIRYASRKAYAEVRPRVKGRFARKEEMMAWGVATGRVHSDDIDLYDGVVPQMGCM